MAHGGKREGSGRPKGSENKATAKVRSKIAEFADMYVEQFIEDVKRVSVDDPKGAADLFLKAIEYHIPKLARTESTVELKGDKEWLKQIREPRATEEIPDAGK